ncbi:hypothetical protein [Synechococcus phage S-B43]|nr:hypothetical protein [Synechococcus phage S-B43]
MSIKGSSAGIITAADPFSLTIPICSPSSTLCISSSHLS